MEKTKEEFLDEYSEMFTYAVTKAQIKMLLTEFLEDWDAQMRPSEAKLSGEKKNAKNPNSISRKALLPAPCRPQFA
jgi:hypothetical protein